MSRMRQKTQYEQRLLAFAPEDRGGTSDADRKGTEPLTARRNPESPAEEERLMEEACDRENLEIAWKCVRENKGSPGVDGLTGQSPPNSLEPAWAGWDAGRARSDGYSKMSFTLIFRLENAITDLDAITLGPRRPGVLWG